MENKIIEPFKIIGIAIRTTNENNQAATDIGNLWGKFMGENVMASIPNKVDNTIYSIYTEYESDFTKPYTTMLGCKVNSLNDIPDGLLGKTFEGGEYIRFNAKGDLAKGIVYSKWVEIWNKDLNRKYTADFEVYGEKSQNPSEAEVEIFIAIN
jgi:predicted transcriptional regulator YdeE